MFCSNCGTKVDDDDLFCPNCGSPLNSQEFNEKIPEYQQEQNYQEYDVEEPKIEKSHTAFFIIMGVIITILISGIAFGVYKLLKLNDEGENYESPKVTISKGKDDKKDEGDKSANDAVPTASPTPTKAPVSTPTPTVVITPTPTAVIIPTPDEVEPELTTSDYILSESNTKYLSYSDVEGLSKDQMFYARNEIYARHGRKFKNEQLQNYFNSKSWYKPIHDGEVFDSMQKTIFNDYEKENIKLITRVEEEKGYTSG